MVSFPDPHHPFNPPGKYWDMYKPEQFPVPEAFSRNDWTPPPLVRNIIDEREAGKANLAGMNTIGVSAREAQEARALTCGMIACIDDAIGGVLAALDRNGTPRRHRGDVHQRPRRPPRRSPADAQGRRAIPEHRAGAVHLVRSAGFGSANAHRCARLDHGHFGRRSSTAPRSSHSAACRRSSLLPALCGAQGPRDGVFIQYDHQHPSPGTDVPPRVHTLIDGRYRLSVFHGTGWGELYDLAERSGRVR